MKSLSDAAVKTEILPRIGNVQANARSRWGRMSADQMLCHLSDAFRLSMGEKSASPATGILQRSVLKWTALYVPVRWPKGFKTRPEMEQGAGGTRPSEFERDRKTLIGLIERFSNPSRDFQWDAHPIFGRMSDGEWLRWGYLHSDHHLRQFGV